MSRTIAVADIGGTNARFALATIAGAEVAALSEPLTLATSAHPTFADAWRAFCARNPGSVPNSLAMAFAGPVEGGAIRLTNNDWSIDREELEALGIDHSLILNDFGAIAHAAATLGGEYFEPLCGPPGDLPRDGVLTVLGPGTGLGVALALACGDSWQAVETEAGHAGFAPVDAVEDRVVARLRERFGRVSAERLVSGPGLANLHWALHGEEVGDETYLWTRALDRADGAAQETFERWCAMLGAIAGDLALAQGASAVVVAGGLGYRLRHLLPSSPFAARFADKAPFEQRMKAIPVRLLIHPQPGLYGAALAFSRRAK